MSPVPDHTSLLDADEPLAFTVTNAAGRSPFVITCDHASNRVPRRLADLGLPAAELGRHIAWDIGALAVARRLSGTLDAPLVAAGYSRLVVDLNRPEHAADRMPETSDGTAVAGNRGLSDDGRRLRLDTLFAPYHRAVAGLLDARKAAGQPNLLVCLHSFTPQLAGRAQRPWHVGTAGGTDKRMAQLLAAELGREAGLVVGYDQPYSIGPDSDYGLPIHGDSRGIPAVLIEIRQDGVADDAGAAAWADRLTRALAAIAPTLLAGDTR